MVYCEWLLIVENVFWSGRFVTMVRTTIPTGCSVEIEPRDTAVLIWLIALWSRCWNEFIKLSDVLDCQVTDITLRNPIQNFLWLFLFKIVPGFHSEKHPHYTLLQTHVKKRLCFTHLSHSRLNYTVWQLWCVVPLYTTISPEVCVMQLPLWSFHVVSEVL
jgi:hypothetical protein